jgi:hypothetical protein
MEPLTEDERRAFLELYSFRDKIPTVAKPVLDALIRRGLLSRRRDKTLAFTKLGDELFEKMRPDEPYEGV